MNDCEIILIDKTGVGVLKTIAPFGLNIDKGYDY